jgi:ankyrin repeat protein
MHLPPEIFTIVHPYLSLHDISSLVLTNHEVNRWVDMNGVICEYYLTRQFKHDELAQVSCQYGYINLLMYLHRIKTTITEYAMPWASHDGHLDIVEFLYSVGADPTVDNNLAIRWASDEGHLDIVKYLCSVGADPTVQNNCPIKEASGAGRLDVVKYLHSVGADLTVQNNYPIRSANQGGHYSVVDYLLMNGATL